MLMLESIPAENRSHTHPTLVESLRSHPKFLSYVWKKYVSKRKDIFDNHFSDILLVADYHCVSFCSWSLHIEERKNKHLKDRIWKQTNLANSIFTDWSVMAAMFASMLVYVPTCPLMTPLDEEVFQIKWTEDLETANAFFFAFLKNVDHLRNYKQGWKENQ